MKYTKTKIIIYQTLKNIQSYHVERLKFVNFLMKCLEDFDLKRRPFGDQFSRFLPKKSPLETMKPFEILSIS